MAITAGIGAERHVEWCRNLHIAISRHIEAIRTIMEMHILGFIVHVHCILLIIDRASDLHARGVNGQSQEECTVHTMVNTPAAAFDDADDGDTEMECPPSAWHMHVPSRAPRTDQAKYPFGNNNRIQCT